MVREQNVVQKMNALKPTQKGMGTYQMIGQMHVVRQISKHQIHLNQNR